MALNPPARINRVSQETPPKYTKEQWAQTLAGELQNFNNYYFENFNEIKTTISINLLPDNPVPITRLTLDESSHSRFHCSPCIKITCNRIGL